MKNKTWVHALLYAWLLALLLVQTHRVQRFQQADQEARRAEIQFAAEDLATTEALQTKIEALHERLVSCGTAGSIVPDKTAAMGR